MSPNETLHPKHVRGDLYFLTNKDIVGHDLFRRAGLGKTALEILMALKQGPAPASVIAQRTGRGRSTIYRNLAKMAASGVELATSGAGIWSIAPNIDVDRIAEKIQVAGIREKRSKQYKREQETLKRAMERGGFPIKRH